VGGVDGEEPSGLTICSLNTYRKWCPLTWMWPLSKCSDGDGTVTYRGGWSGMVLEGSSSPLSSWNRLLVIVVEPLMPLSKRCRCSRWRCVETRSAGNQSWNLSELFVFRVLANRHPPA